MIKAVLFDYGGVLSPGGTNFRDQLSKHLGIKTEELRTDEIGPGLWDGSLAAEEFYARLSRLHKTKVTSEEFLEISGILTRNRRVYELAAQLRQHDIKTGIFSNMYSGSANTLREHGNYDMFDPIVLSFEQKGYKPQTEFYQKAITMTGVKPSEILFIDDQARYLGPAQSLGIKTLLATDQDQVVRDTKAILKKENGLTL